MNNKKGFIMLFILLSVVIVFSNMITAKYIEYKVSSKMRVEAENMRYQVRNIQTTAPYINPTKEKKWNDVMAPTELAKYLDIELDQVYTIIDDKESEIPYVLIEGAYRFSKTAIDEWLTSRKSIVGDSLVY